MKPAAFSLERPRDLEEVLALLEQLGDDAKVIAGGQSLVPMLNLRLAKPRVLIDLQQLRDLSYIRRGRQGGSFGALTRHIAVETSPVVASHWQALAEGMTHVAHPQIRNRGTLGGSLSHADPSAELPTLMAVLDATFVVRSASRTREVPWKEFFLGPFETTLEADELLVEARVPTLPPRAGSAFAEYARRTGDYAVGGAGAVVALAPDGRVEHAAVALLGAPGSPVRAMQAEAALRGSAWSDRAPAEAAAAAVADIMPSDSAQGTGQYKRRIIQAQTEKAIRLAHQRAEAAQ